MHTISEKSDAQMAESVDALVSNTSRFTPVPVRPRLWVQKTLVERILRGFLLFKTSKMVTFGHHFENGGPKMGSNKGIKKCRKFRFLRAEQQKNFFLLLHRKFFPNRQSMFTIIDVAAYSLVFYSASQMII